MSIPDEQLADGTEDPMPRTPWVSLLLAYVAMVPIVAGVAWCLVGGQKAGLPVRLTIVWAGAVLCFLAGVRRGLSPVASRRREAPVYFQRLRPVQMLVPIASLALLTVWIAF